ncbi:MAG: thioredoxin-like domain-containing protein [Breznakibacter sp.]
MRNLLLLFTILIGLSSCKDNKYSVSGKFDNAAGETVIFQRLNLNGTDIIDSMKIKKDGSFEFESNKLSEPTFFQLTIKPNKNLVLLIDSTENIVVKADLKSFETSVQISQSIGSQELYKVTSKAAKLQKNIQTKLETLEKLPKEDNYQREQLQNEIKNEIEEYKNFIYSYIFENPRSFVSYYALFQNILNLPLFDVMDQKDHISFATIATSLNMLYPESERVKHLYQYVLNAKATMKQQKVSNILLNNAETVGTPDIEENNIYGNKVKLSDLRGKVVLLSFWAAWDEASRKENKNLLKVYNKYHSKGFEVFQVSLDKSKVLWESAIKQDNLPWINVSDLKYTSSYWARLYNINKIPANFLISKNGDLIGKDLFGSMLDEKVANAIR